MYEQDELVISRMSKDPMGPWVCHWDDSFLTKLKLVILPNIQTINLQFYKIIQSFNFIIIRQNVKYSRYVQFYWRNLVLVLLVFHRSSSSHSNTSQYLTIDGDCGIHFFLGFNADINLYHVDVDIFWHYCNFAFTYICK